jgi:group II intron reverse transcriptase/maturase
MRTAKTILSIIRERGQRGLPLTDVYRLLYQKDLYLRAYGKLYRNQGAMTPGPTPETVDGMSMAKIEAIIERLRYERYRWTPVRRTYIPKKNGKMRPLGMPSWSDKLLQEVIRAILEAYYEPQFSDCSHGFRPGRGCHTALQHIRRVGKATKWFIEGDISACFDDINHQVMLGILGEHIRDNRFLRLIRHLLEAGYLEDWTFKATFSGVPQGGVVSPILANVVLDRLDQYVETVLLPRHHQGVQRKSYAPYVLHTVKASQARRKGDLDSAWQHAKAAQMLPSRDPNDPNFRRLWYVRYADDFLLGYTGPKAEAVEIKQQIATFLEEHLKLRLSAEKTLITHGRDERARFLGYEIHIHHDNHKHHGGKRCINGSVGLRVPEEVIRKHCAPYLRHGQPIHRPERLKDSAHSIMARYQAEYSGLVQYYRMAYNLHMLSRVKWVAEQSLVKTLAGKFRTSCRKIYRRFGGTVKTGDKTYKVLSVTVERGPDKKPLTAHFGGISLSWNPYASLGEMPTMIWSGRSELEQRLLAERCELCGQDGAVEVHHIHKLAALKGKSQWQQVMAARRRKTLVVCPTCHQQIHSGQYDGPPLSKSVAGEPCD